LALLAAWALLWALRSPSSKAERERLSYSELKAMVTRDEIAAVQVGPDLIVARLKAAPPAEGGEAKSAGGSSEGATSKGPPREVLVVPVADDTLLPLLEAHQVKITGERETRGLGDTLGWLIPPLLLVGFWVFMLRRIGQGGVGGMGGGQGFLTVGRNKARVYMEKDIAVRFADVAGVDEAKQELEEIIQFLRDRERFGRLGAHIPKGVLLVGPPGTGKTLLARAVAGEAGVPFFSISGSEFVELFVGVGAARVRDLFVEARGKAPCIIFIDELDALGKARGMGPMAHEEREQTLNQLLVEMDGFDPRTGVILMAATNRPEILDPALLRAGRFDRHVLVDRPDKVGRLAILRLHAKKIALEDEADLESIAGMTVGFVGADLANLINEAALLGVRRSREKVGRAELQEAVERVVAGLEKRNRVLTVAEKERVAHHEVGHALVALALPGTDPVQKISIIPRGIAALGYTLQVPTEDRFLMTRHELEDKIAVLLGGRAAEELVYEDVSTGAEDDLRKATEIARSMVRSYGMSPRLPPRSFDGPRPAMFLPGVPEERRGDHSEATARLIDAEVGRIVQEQRARARQVLGERRATLSAAARRLLTDETISGEVLQEIARVEGAAPVEAARSLPGEAVTAELVEQRGAGEAEAPRGQGAVPGAGREDPREHLALERVELRP
jgi:cell division protease FtsH